MSSLTFKNLYFILQTFLLFYSFSSVCMFVCVTVNILSCVFLSVRLFICLSGTSLSRTVYPCFYINQKFDGARPDYPVIKHYPTQPWSLPCDISWKRPCSARIWAPAARPSALTQPRHSSVSTPIFVKFMWPRKRSFTDDLGFTVRPRLIIQ